MDKTSARLIGPILLIIMGIILVLGVLVYKFSGPLLNQFGPAPAATLASVDRVSLNDALQAYTAHTAVFVDVRSSDAYQAGHVNGAVNIPLAEIKDRRNELDKARWIIPYCT
jgi:hypothetical protein